MTKIRIFTIFICVLTATFLVYGHNNITLGNVQIYELGTVVVDTEDTKYDSSDIINSSKDVMYAIDKKTGMAKDLFNIEEMSGKNLHINIEESGPKVLIFHTHGSEMYADSKNVNDGVIGVGEHLKKTLEDRYGVECLHITDRFDFVDGRLKRDGAYERAEPVIANIIRDNPSIELVIDLHRDGVNENLRLVTNIDGKPYAKIMFFNGICRKWENGELKPIKGLENPYVKTNLALSYQMQKAVLDFNENLPRKIYINAYRYSLHFKDKSMLVELGAQTNTVEEATNSIEVVAEAIAKVCLE